MEEEKKPEVEVKNPAHLLAKRLQGNRESLHIARVPPKTKEEFTKWAKDEFCGDYGMALKFLWDGMPKGDILGILELVQEQEIRRFITMVNLLL